MIEAKWEIFRSFVPDKKERLLANGWEPFSVVPHAFNPEWDTIYFKRLAQPKKKKRARAGEVREP